MATAGQMCMTGGDLEAGTLSFGPYYEYIGYIGPGTFNQSAGTNKANELYLGLKP